MAHVEKRGKNSWRLVVTIGYDDKGVPIRERKTVKAKNKTDAEKKLAIFEAQILTGEYVKPERMTVIDLFREWDKHVTEDEISVTTKDDYRNRIKSRIIPKFGHMNISDVKPINVLSFINSLKKEGIRLDGKEGKLSPSTINNYYKAFNHLFEFAKRMMWVSSNPVQNVQAPTVEYKEVEIYTPRDLITLVNGLDKINVEFSKQVLIAIALTSSARQGEIAALEEKSCDFTRGGIHITQSLAVQKGKGVVLKGTKNKQQRFLPLPDQVMDMIKKLLHIRKQEVFKAGELREWPNHLFLFANEFGKPIRPDSISQWWMRLVRSERFKSLGLKPIRFHDLRHSSLTYLSSRGLRPKAVQERAGHTRIDTTFDFYGHVLPEENLEAVNYLSDIFENTAEK